MGGMNRDLNLIQNETITQVVGRCLHTGASNGTSTDYRYWFYALADKIQKLEKLINISGFPRSRRQPEKFSSNKDYFLTAWTHVRVSYTRFQDHRSRRKLDHNLE